MFFDLFHNYWLSSICAEFCSFWLGAATLVSTFVRQAILHKMCKYKSLSCMLWSTIPEFSYVVKKWCFAINMMNRKLLYM